MSLSALKQRLSSLGYIQPLAIESAPLVDALLTDLLASHEESATLRTEKEHSESELVGLSAQVAWVAPWRSGRSGR